MSNAFIERVELINFQSHSNTVLEFSNGINGIIAPSNVGKSSVSRIVQWLLYNNIPGEPHYIKTGEDFAIGRVTFSTGIMIEREIHAPQKNGERKVKKNFYRLYRGSELVEEITGFGTKVPTIIQEAHNMMPSNKRMNLHFWNQLDKPFLVTDKPADRAEAMGNLEELQMVDTSLIEINSEILADTKSRNATETRIKELEKQIAAVEEELELDQSRKVVVESMLGWCDVANDVLMKFEKHTSDLSGIKRQLADNDALIQKTSGLKEMSIEKVEEMIRNINLIARDEKNLSINTEQLSALPDIKQSTIDVLVEGMDIVMAQEAILNRIERLKEDKKEFDLRKANVPKPIDTSSLDIEGVQADISMIRTIMGTIDSLVQNAKDIETQKQRYETAQANESKALSELLEALHNIEICPTCGQATDNVDEHAVQHTLQS